MDMKLTVLFAILLLCSKTLALTEADLNSIESQTLELLKKEPDQSKRFKAVLTLAREMDGYDKLEKAEKYYLMALKDIPSTEDSLPVATSYLSILFKGDKEKAKNYFDTQFSKDIKSSPDEKKNEILSFWNEVFHPEIKDQNHKGFYGHYFKKRDIKELMKKKEYKKALSLIDENAIKNASINEKIEFDILSFLNGKKHNFLCEDMLKQYPDSFEVTLDLCRHILKKKVKAGSLESLKKAVREEAPTLSYLVEPLTP